METSAELRESINATRSVIKAWLRTGRTALQMLTDLEERLNALDAQPEEAQRHDRDRDTAALQR